MQSVSQTRPVTTGQPGSGTAVFGEGVNRDWVGVGLGARYTQVIFWCHLQGALVRNATSQAPAVVPMLGPPAAYLACII